MKIAETPTDEEVDRNHEDQNVAYVAIQLDNTCRDLLRADYGRLKERGAAHLIDEARRNLGQI